MQDEPQSQSEPTKLPTESAPAGLDAVRTGNTEGVVDELPIEQTPETSTESTPAPILEIPISEPVPEVRPNHLNDSFASPAPLTPPAPPISPAINPATSTASEDLLKTPLPTTQEQVAGEVLPEKAVPASPSVESKQAPILPVSLKSFLNKALEKIRFRKQAKLEKIIKFVSEKGKVTNNQVQKLLRVSDATATRYLVQLVKQGKLVRQGKQKNPIYRLP